MKTCTKCKELKEDTAFSRQSRSKDGLQPWCKECRKVADARNYRENPKRRLSIREINQIGIDVRKAFVRNYLKQHPCVDCGEKDPIVLEFDHVTGDKEANVSRLVMCAASISRIEKEIAKCEVRCCNCHRRVTAQRGGWNKSLITPL